MHAKATNSAQSSAPRLLLATIDPPAVRPRFFRAFVRAPTHPMRFHQAPAALLLALAAFCAVARADDPAGGPPAGHAPGVLRYAFPIAETGFDPPQISDLYSAFILSNIFDTLLTYDYLARPVKVVPNVAEALPEVSPDGLTWTLKVKRGIYFTDDPAFGGKRRELTAADFVYSIKRVYDPKWKSPQLYNVEGFIVGMDDIRKKALATGKMDYDTPVEGIQALDRYTIRFKLTKHNYDFINTLTFCQVSCAVAREVIEAAPDKAMEHPVGTGPYVLSEWRRSSHIVLTANPTYREVYYDPQPAADDARGQAIKAQLKGRRLPMTPRVEISIIEQTQPRWLSFLNNEEDLIERLPEEFANQAVPNGKLAPNLAKRGMKVDRNPGLEVTFTYFAMENPVIGGYTPDKVALRRAISLGYNGDEEIRIVRRNQAIPAEQPVGPGAIGYDPTFHSVANEYDPAKARALLDLYGYVDRDGDGYREMPDGKPLVIERWSQPTQVYKEIDEIWKKDMDAIGIRMTVQKQQFPELLKQSKAGQLMMWGLAWSANTPDASTFYGTLYGGGVGQINHARFNLPEYNELYEKSREIPDGPERDAMYNRMNKLAVAYMPWKFGVHRIYTDIMQPWVYGYHRNPVLNNWWPYIDIDGDAQKKALSQ
jgi:ABC-type transport system substrate-binding protein